MDGAPMHDGSKVSIRPKAINQEYVCVTKGGNPSPEILWYRIPKGFAASTPLRKRMQLKTEDGLRVIGASDHLTATYESRLLLSVRTVKNGDRLVCTVSNEATKRHHDRQRKYLKTTVHVELQSKLCSCLPIHLSYFIHFNQCSTLRKRLTFESALLV